MISFDVWDTLLRRRCHPDAIKIFATQKFFLENIPEYSTLSPGDILKERQRVESIVAKRNLDLGYDDEYPINMVYEEFGSNIAHQYRDFELFLETKFTYPSRAIRKYLQKYDGEKIGFISDFYFGKNEIKYLLDKNFPAQNWDIQMSSADYLKNKRSGRLFEHLEKSDGWIHIGDNPHSDVVMARKMGAKAILFRPISESLKRGSIHRRYSRRIDGDLKYEESLEFNFAVGLVAMTSLLRSRSHHGWSICFCEREGAFIKKIFDLTNHDDPFGQKPGTSVLLPVSRISTAAPSFHENPKDTLFRITSQYSKISPENLAKALSLPPDFFPRSYDGLTGKELMTEIVKNELLIESMKEDLSYPASAFQRYFENLKLNQKILLVDIGWSGTIQANVKTALGNDYLVEGFYIATRDNAWKSLKFTSLFEQFRYSQDFYKIMRSVRPLEILFGSELGSVLYFEKLEGTVATVRNEPKDVPPESFLKFQNEIFNHIPGAVKFIKDNLLTIDEATKFLFKSSVDFVSNPPRELVRDYLKLHVDETFGLGSTFDLSQTGKRINGLLKKGTRQALREYYWRFGWPEAILFKYLNFVPPKNIVESLGSIIWGRSKFSKVLRSLKSKLRKRRH